MRIMFKSQGFTQQPYCPNWVYHIQASHPFILTDLVIVHLDLDLGKGAESCITERAAQSSESERYYWEQKQNIYIIVVQYRINLISTKVFLGLLVDTNHTGHIGAPTYEPSSEQFVDQYTFTVEGAVKHVEPFPQHISNSIAWSTFSFNFEQTISATVP